MSERAFLEAIIAEPDEDAHRLVFADWLDEHGQAERAEFIRIQCALARMPDDDPCCAELEVRERRLLAANVSEWAAPWPAFQNHEYAVGSPERAEFRRGFLESITLDDFPPLAPPWGEQFRRLFDAHPIRELIGGGARIAGREELRRIEALSVSTIADPRAGTLDVESFLRSSGLSRLRRLLLRPLMWSTLKVPGDQLEAWFRLPIMARLEAINDLSDRTSDAGFFRTLANGDFPELRELALPSCLEEAVPAVRELIHSALWPRLRKLTVHASEAFPWPAALEHGRFRHLVIRGRHRQSCTELALALIASRGLALEELDVSGDFCHGDTLSDVLACPALAGLRRLSLGSYTGLTADDMRRLARAPCLRSLNRLSLYLFGGGPYADAEEGLAALFGSPHLGRLTHLCIDGNYLSVPAVHALARNPACRRLRNLKLPPDQSATAFAALAAGESFPDLHTLRLNWWQAVPDVAALGSLLHSPKLPRLCVVDFGISADQVESIAGAFRACERIAWAGGEMFHNNGQGDSELVSVKPGNVYLPHHLADF